MISYKLVSFDTVSLSGSQHHSLLVPLHLSNKTNSAWFHDIGSPICFVVKGLHLHPVILHSHLACSLFTTSAVATMWQKYTLELGRWMHGTDLKAVLYLGCRMWSGPFNRQCSKTSFTGVFQLAWLAANSFIFANSADTAGKEMIERKENHLLYF